MNLYNGNSNILYFSQYPNIHIKNKSTAQKSVTLSFDDGPSEHLERILTILKNERIPAMFFFQGNQIQTHNPLQKVLEYGHEIGSHSSNHIALSSLSKEEQYKEIKDSIETIESQTNRRVRYFRPPYGDFNEDTLQIAEKLNIQVVMWRIASLDWELEQDPPQIITNVIQHLEDKAIILRHEFQQTVHILPKLIEEIRKSGYTFSLLEEERGLYGDY
ncbi:polysaccharide deacetylase family protein [Radiobacillus deserti]|uniref:Polysaccharide deacetylase family protein n=1 Tax=Radiobacillus deserti TaxID=2594883 RepID=A0A516KEP0_9BACI|nr:polysaccharide deacetylase family protein [Radiobacillus deserti]QDP39874.1 polysaccharide deacetylase family protein [Radiobacillus deserti]